MAKDLFSNLDLNLLRTFIVLDQERNMRKAAERLFVSQPAVSKALQRLRDHFGDKLFVKTYHGLRATEHAERLSLAISPLIEQLALSVNSVSDFDPKGLDGVLKFAVSPFLGGAVSSKLFQAIRADAPNVEVHFLNWSKNTQADIINGEIALGVNYDIAYTSKQLIQTKVASDSFQAYVRQDHPYTKAEIEIKDGVDFELATIIGVDWNERESMAEKMLKLRGFPPKIAFRSEIMSAVLDIVRHSDIMFPASRLVSLESHDLRKIQILYDKHPFSPDLCAYSHSRDSNNPKTQWLHSVFKSVLSPD